MIEFVHYCRTQRVTLRTVVWTASKGNSTLCSYFRHWTYYTSDSIIYHPLRSHRLHQVRKYVYFTFFEYSVVIVDIDSCYRLKLNLKDYELNVPLQRKIMCEDYKTSSKIWLPNHHHGPLKSIHKNHNFALGQ